MTVRLKALGLVNNMQKESFQSPQNEYKGKTFEKFILTKLLNMREFMCDLVKK